MKRLLLLSLLTITGGITSNARRTVEYFDSLWLFSMSDDTAYQRKDYNEGEQWKTVDTPHDWEVEMPFSWNARGGGAAAYIPESVGWYRKHFLLPPKWKGKRVYILFDGIFHQSAVYINGRLIGKRPYGYSWQEYDLTPYLDMNGENVIAVRCDCTGDRPRWYAGAGIFRHVRLTAVNDIHVAAYGTYITTPIVTDDEATVTIITTVVNKKGEDNIITIGHKITDPNGTVVAKGTTLSDSLSLKVPRPKRWSPDSPALYTVETTVRANGKEVDRYKSSFGIRTIMFDQDKGFFLNGKAMKLKGLCLHDDGGALGTAQPVRSMERKLLKLKEYGCNALRLAHHPYAPEFLTLCDKIGFLVIDEAFDKWKSGYYARYFDEWWQRDLADMIIRDRNHPSVILWSIGNELQEAWDSGEEGVKRARMLNDYVHRLEPTRPTTLAAQNNHQAKFAATVDVTGYNYLEARAVNDHKRYPQRRMLISEELPYYSGEEGNLRSYSTVNPWNIVAANDFIAGGFIWSGVDYLGEAAGPGPSRGWPNGLFDITLREKPRAMYHRALWNTNKPAVGLAVLDPSIDLDHGRDLWQWPNMAAIWNFPDRYEGLVMDLVSITNCERVSLFFNGKLMGTRKTADFPNNTILWHIPYKKGRVVAIAFNDSLPADSAVIETTLRATSMSVLPDRERLTADGQDLCYIDIWLKDSEGRIVKTDDRQVTVSVEGAGSSMGMMSGDLRHKEPLRRDTVNTFFGHAQAVVKTARKKGTIRVTIEAEGIGKQTLTLTALKKNT